MDENVHVSQSLRLADALVKESKDFDLLIVPNAGHGVLLTSGYAQRRMWDYFIRHLLGRDPPENFDLRFCGRELERFAERYLQEVMQ